MYLSYLPRLSFGAFIALLLAIFSNPIFGAGVVFVETVLDIEEAAGSIGSDPGGLDGARLTLNTSFDTSGVYLNRTGRPAVVSQTHTVTVTGSSVSANNQTYTLANPILFLPTFAGFYTEPDGLSNISFVLASGGPIFFGVQENPTPTGSSAIIGGSILLSHFEGNVVTSFNNFTIDGTTYDLVAASQTAIPEPASAAILGIATLACICLVRRRR